MIRRTLLEWGKLPYGPDPGNSSTIPESAADRLAAVAEASIFSGRGGDGVLEHGRRALRARGVVGVLAADGCSLEILPKIDVVAEPGERAQNGAIRRRLVHMLSVALDLKIDVGRVTELDWQRETLLEILIRIFCEKLADALRHGMPRQYIAHEDDLPALRGRLDVVRQFTRNAVNPSRLACRFDVLSEDIALNRIMRAAVTRLARIAHNPENQRHLRELTFSYSEVSDVHVSALRWDDVVLDRTNKRWRELLGLARMLLQSQFQTTSSGPNSGFSLMFEMNLLFEAFMGRLIVRAARGSALQVTLQGGLRYCLSDVESGRQLFQTKPDILIRSDGQIVHVIDTKWKRISSKIDHAKQGVGQADVYQMMAYGQLYRAPRLTLLYPHHAGLARSEGVQSRHRVGGQEAILNTSTFDVAAPRNIEARVRSLLSLPDENELSGLDLTG